MKKYYVSYVYNIDLGKSDREKEGIFDNFVKFIKTNFAY